MLLLPNNHLQLPPLFLRRINPRRVLRTDMQQDNTPLFGILDVLLHSLEIEPNRLLVKVAVSHNL